MSSFCVIGLGRFGQTIATELEKNGHQVLIIDYNAAVVNALSDMVTNAVVGDPMNPDVLRAAGVKNYDCAVVCFSERINDSIIVTMMLKEMGIKKVVVRANSEIDKKILYKIGADSVVFPEQDMGKKLAYMLDKNDVMEHIRFSDEYSIVEKKVPLSWVGKSILELDVRKRYHINIIAICDNDKGTINISPSPEYCFEASDVITLIGSNKDIDRISKDG